MGVSSRFQCLGNNAMKLSTETDEFHHTVNKTATSPFVWVTMTETERVSSTSLYKYAVKSDV